MILFDREQLENGLSLLVTKLHSTGVRAGIRIVGGAAIALRYFERDATTDIDGRSVGDATALALAVSEVAAENGWQTDWLNTSAAQFIPDYGTATQWETLYDDGLVTVEVASAATLLAMKLRANRPGRDDADIASLLVLVDLDTIDAIDDFYESYYPGDSLSDRGFAMVTRILAVGLPERPTELPTPVIELRDRRS